MIRMPFRFLHLGTSLLLALAALEPVHAQQAATPRQLIENLDLEVRRLLHETKPARSPEQAEEAVAEAIAALVARSPGHLSLTDADERGHTPLMLAARGPYPRVVQALLADPSVKLRVNQPDAAGATAWMLASFAPALTLPACEPAALTRERYPLLPPYLRRMASLLQTQAAPVSEVVNLLQQAGADLDAEAAKRVWLAQCPNATPALREALAGGNLLRTLVSESTRAVRDFNETARKDVNLLPGKPPADMKFVQGDRDRHGQPLPALDIEKMTCDRMPKPEMKGTIPWSGSYVVRLFARTRAGVIEAVDFELQTRMRSQHEARIAAYFNSLILSALSGYECKGDRAFEQTFEFSIR
jgi:hypothetical protein